MKSYSTLLLLFISSFCIAQQLKTYLTVSPGISYYSGSADDKRPGLSLSGVLGEDLFFPKTFSLGVQIAYRYANASFKSQYSGVSIPEIKPAFKHYLSNHSIELPVLLRIRNKEDINNTCYFYVGIGLSYIMQAYRSVDVIKTYTPPSQKPEVAPLTEGSTILKTNGNKVGTITKLGLGKNTIIKNKTFFYELSYTMDINQWYYLTDTDPVYAELKLRRQNISLNFGILF